MTRENILFAIIGILLGFIVGFIFASTVSQRNAMGPMATTSPGLPADHPQVGGNNPASSGGMQAEVTEALAKARNEPQNFEAQIKAAQLYMQIQRYDQAIEYLLKANQIQPENVEAIALLGDVNLERGNFDEALTWYQAALKRKPSDVSLLASVAFTQLQKGDAKGAEKAIADLEKADPTSQDLPQFKQRLASLQK